MSGEEGQLNFKLQALHEDVAEIRKSMDKMSDAIARLAVIEERQTNNAQAVERAFNELGKIDSRLQQLELKQPLNTHTNQWVDRVVWALLSGLVVYVVNGGRLPGH